MISINIIARDNSYGLSTDIKILTDLFLRQGWKVNFSDYKSLKQFSFWSKNYYDLNIFLQWAKPSWMKMAKKNVLIPNPEWFKDKWIHVINKFDAIFCKTKIAAEIFQPKNNNTFFTSFTSIDRYIPSITREDNHWLHVAGKSTLKGTDTIIKTWLKNPKYPHLTIIRKNPEIVDKSAHNLGYISGFIEKKHLQKILNSCPVHLCTSATEGFGHYIVEALSCGSMVVTTDAPPMNELVNQERGFLVKPASKKKMRLATAYHISQKELENTINKVVKAKQHEKLMKNARDFFLTNDRYFKNEIVKRIKDLVKDH